MFLRNLVQSNGKPNMVHFVICMKIHGHSEPKYLGPNNILYPINAILINNATDYFPKLLTSTFIT